MVAPYNRYVVMNLTTPYILITTVTNNMIPF